MTDAVYAALRAAVNLSRYENVLTVALLRSTLLADGHKAEDIQEALVYWATSLKE